MLTPQQQKFLEEYLIDFNGKEAAIRAGYSESNARFQASRILASEEGEAYLQQLREEQKERSAINADMVIAGLLQEARFDGKGASHMARVRAWEVLGKHLRMFIEKRSEDSPDPDEITITRLDRGKADS